MSRYVPPAVRFPLSSPKRLRIGLFALWGMAAALLLGWSWHTVDLIPGWVSAMGWGLWLVAGLVLRADRHRPLNGWLWWDGGAWWWLPALEGAQEPVTRLQVLCDAQVAMLLQVEIAQTSGQSSRGSVFVGVVTRSRDPLRWGDLRRAVYSK